jgi:chemotaxis protein methyltransferase CheR
LLSAPLSRQQVETLAFHLTVKETYFFRETKIFEVLESRVLPELIKVRGRSDKRIRVWSAGCSTGEEPYSIAILLSRLLPDIKDWNIFILATDINPRVLKEAREGIYGEWSFRDTPPWVKEQYFDQMQNGRYTIRPSTRNMVTFAYLNLCEDVYPSLTTNTNAMDIVFCRNVLMYFAPEYAAQAVERYSRSLVEGGFFITSVVEVSTLLSRLFDPVRFGDTTFYRKNRSYASGENKALALLTDKTPRSTPFPPVTGLRRPLKRASAKAAGAPGQTSGKPTPYNEASSLYRQGLYREAEVMVVALMRQDGNNPKVDVLLARIMANLGKLTAARRWCERAISADKLNPGSYYLLATILEEQGQSCEAMVSLEKALYLNHDFVLAHFAMGNLKLKSGKVAGARRHFRNTGELLSRYGTDEIIPESEGISSGRLAEIVRSIMP